MAAAMQVPISELANAMNTQVENWQKGFDQLLMLQGMKATAQSITLPQPKEFMEASLMSFAASMLIPVKILVGSQTGERASTEDADEWELTNNSRRQNQIMPIIRQFIGKLVDAGILENKDWVTDWSDLTESSLDQKLDQAAKMADINAKQADDPVFTVDELREHIGMDPLPEGTFEDDELDSEEEPPAEEIQPEPTEDA
jgi:hypothetical protein